MHGVLLVGSGGVLPADLAQQVALRGGTVSGADTSFGIAHVHGASADVLAQLPGIDAVLPNIAVAGPAPLTSHAVTGPMNTMALLEAAGNDEPYFPVQWALQAIDAPQAWELGHRGANVRVAVLDAGVRRTHPDIAPNINVALSRSFVPGQAWDAPTTDNATHVAGIIGAADNGVGTIGVAPDAELVAVRVLPNAGLVDVFGVLAGIVYAADIESDVINMSFGFDVPTRPYLAVDDQGTPDPADDLQMRVSAADAMALVDLFRKATVYANKRGATIVASSGNNGRDFDAIVDRVRVPQQLPHVLTVRSTGPTGWAFDHTTDLDRLAPYSNFGISYLSFAAPGGNPSLLASVPASQLCTSEGFTVPCFVFDFVVSPAAGPWGWGWQSGGNLAAPHVAGVAALIIGKAGGTLDPAKVDAELRRSADDLGKPGKDSDFGHGRVNAHRAVQ
jgi:subtilisin family serine protease